MLLWLSSGLNLPRAMSPRTSPTSSLDVGRWRTRQRGRVQPLESLVNSISEAPNVAPSHRITIVITRFDDLAIYPGQR